MEQYKIFKIDYDGVKIYKPYQVYRIGHVYADGTPQYRLCKTFSKCEDAQQYITDKTRA